MANSYQENECLLLTHLNQTHLQINPRQIPLTWIEKEPDFGTTRRFDHQNHHFQETRQ